MGKKKKRKCGSTAYQANRGGTGRILKWDPETEMKRNLEKKVELSETQKRVVGDKASSGVGVFAAGKIFSGLGRGKDDYATISQVGIGETAAFYTAEK